MLFPAAIIIAAPQRAISVDDHFISYVRYTDRIGEISVALRKLLGANGDGFGPFIVGLDFRVYHCAIAIGVLRLNSWYRLRIAARTERNFDRCLAPSLPPARPPLPARAGSHPGEAVADRGVRRPPNRFGRRRGRRREQADPPVQELKDSTTKDSMTRWQNGRAESRTGGHRGPRRPGGGDDGTSGRQGAAPPTARAPSNVWSVAVPPGRFPLGVQGVD